MKQTGSDKSEATLSTPPLKPSCYRAETSFLAFITDRTLAAVRWKQGKNLAAIWPGLSLKTQGWAVFMYFQLLNQHSTLKKNTKQKNSCCEIKQNISTTKALKLDSNTIQITLKHIAVHCSCSHIIGYRDHQTLRTDDSHNETPIKEQPRCTSGMLQNKYLSRLWALTERGNLLNLNQWNLLRCTACIFMRVLFRQHAIPQ